MCAVHHGQASTERTGTVCKICGMPFVRNQKLVRVKFGWAHATCGNHRPIETKAA